MGNSHNKNGHHPSSFYINRAEQSGLLVKSGRGSHTKVYGDNGEMMVIPHARDLSPGIENKIRNWLVKFGVVLTIFFIVYLISHPDVASMFYQALKATGAQ